MKFNSKMTGTVALTLGLSFAAFATTTEPFAKLSLLIDRIEIQQKQIASIMKKAHLTESAIPRGYGDYGRLSDRVRKSYAKSLRSMQVKNALDVALSSGTEEDIHESLENAIHSLEERRGFEMQALSEESQAPETWRAQAAVRADAYQGAIEDLSRLRDKPVTVVASTRDSLAREASNVDANLESMVKIENQYLQPVAVSLRMLEIEKPLLKADQVELEAQLNANPEMRTTVARIQATRKAKGSATAMAGADSVQGE